MRKSILFIFLAVIIICIGIIFYKNTNNQKEEQTQTNTSNYQAEKSSTAQNITEKINQKESIDIKESDQKVPKTENEIAEFSTKIYNKDAKRQNNITITCKAISTKEIAPGETFSFCETVGKATSEKGYQEADIYIKGEKKKGLGGGNCQVSTTLYNAVYKVPELEVLERHQHSGNVPYIQKGKDAAVAYGAYDFKFKNNTSNILKIIIESTSENITAKLIEIK